MNDEQAKALGMLAKNLHGFSWQPRMMEGESGGIIGEDTDLIEPDEWPDFRDPPTMGWLLHQVREAWGDPTVFADKQAGHWECEGEHGGHDWMTVGDFEAEALVNALKMAGERNAATPREPHTGKGSARCPQ